MPTNIDELQIEINAKVQGANTAIDRLVGKLDRLSASLGRLNTSNLNTLAMGVNRLGTAMQTMNGVKTADFTRLAKNLERLNLIDVSNLSSISASVNHMATAFKGLENISQTAGQLGELANGIRQLGYKSADKAIENIPKLAVAMKDLMKTLSGAPKVSQNLIDMTNALAKLARTGASSGKAATSLSRSLNTYTKSTTKATSGTKGLAAAFGKFYATWFLVIRGVKKFINAIESTADYIEAFNYYSVSLGKIASDWNQDWEKYGYENAEAYADSFTDRLNKSLSKLSGLQIDESQQLLTETGLKNLGLNIQEITQYASQLASITNSIGQTGEVSLAAASAFTKLAGDISSLFNIDYSSAAQNLQSGLIGQSRALYKYGIDITNATLQTYAYNLGLEKAVSEMTQAEKMQLRMVAILDQSRVSWGDLSRTLNSPSNLMRQFTNNVKEAGMVLGQLFIPVLQKVLPIVNGVVIAIKRLLVSIAQLLGVKLDLDSFGQGYTDLSDGFDDMSDSLDGVASSAKKAKAGLRAFDELKVINMPETSGGAGGVGGAIDLTDEILKATEEYERVWQEAYDRMANKAQEIANAIGFVFSYTTQKIKEGFDEAFQADTSKLEENLKRIQESTKNVWGSPEVLNAIANYSDQVLITTGKVIGSISSVTTSFSVGLTGGIAEAKEKLEEFDKTKISSIFNNLTKLHKTVGDLATAFATIGTAFESDGFSKIVEFFYKLTDITVLNGLDVLTGLASDIFNLFSQPVIDNADKYAEALEHIFNIIGNLLDPFNNLLDVVAENSEGYENSWIHELFVGLTKLESLGQGGILDSINEKLSEMENTSLVAGSSMSNMFAIVSEKAENVKTKAEELWEKIKETWNNASAWFSNNVINPVVNFFTGLKTKVEQIFQGLWLIVQAIWIKVSGWFNENVVAPLVNFFSPIVEKISGFFSMAWEKIKNVWSIVSGWFNSNIINPLSSAFQTACDKIGGFFTNLWSGIKSGVIGAMNAVIGGVESGINFLVDGINNIISGFNEVVSWAAKVAGKDWGNVDLVAKVTIPRIQGYEIGGFPKPYSLFAAGERGRAEMLGTVGGKTAVAGGAEITGIRDAVLASHKEEMELMRQQNELLRGILAKEFGITEQQIGKAAQNYSRDYMRRTGNPAYSF